MKVTDIKIWFCIGALVILIQGGEAQEIITAERYLSMVSEQYAGIRDYEAKIAIRSGNTNMYGTVSHLVPSFLRIDFSTPREQVIVFDGELLTIYLPEDRAILNQSVAGRRSGASLATSQGLSLLRRNYFPAYVTGPAPQPLEEGSNEMVVKLRLTRRSVSEGYRELIVHILPESRLIRRIEGWTIAGVHVQFDFSQIQINQGIPPARFIYDSPASANLYNNFLFRDTD